MPAPSANRATAWACLVEHLHPGPGLTWLSTSICACTSSITGSHGQGLPGEHQCQLQAQARSQPGPCPVAHPRPWPGLAPGWAPAPASAPAPARSPAPTTKACRVNTSAAPPPSAREKPRFSRPLRVSLLTVLTVLRKYKRNNACYLVWSAKKVTGNDGF